MPYIENDATLGNGLMQMVVWGSLLIFGNTMNGLRMGSVFCAVIVLILLVSLVLRRLTKDMKAIAPLSYF